MGIGFLLWGVLKITRKLAFLAGKALLAWRRRAAAAALRLVSIAVNAPQAEAADAKTEMMQPKGRTAYEIFQATLLLDNGQELALRGAELERELTSNSCQVGNRVAITPMGKVPGELANGVEGSKNLYRVKNMTGAGKG